MSYARFGWDNSDVYVFTSRSGIECCGCILQEMEVVETPGAFFGFYLKPVGEIIETRFKSNQGMIDHLQKHVEKGHTVPDYVFERLNDPKDEEENKKHWEE